MASVGNMDYSNWSKPDAVIKVSILLLLGTNVVAGYGEHHARASLDVSSGVGLGFGVGRRQTLDNYSARQKISRQGAIRVPPVFVDTMTFKDQEDVPPLISTALQSFCNSMNETLGDMRQKIDRLENRLADVSSPTVLTTA
ncbi:hypothetical protein BSKO_12204 [Bryopsis sp. KO-2023]|nr:hypothetical protein BSKO_12204 [Bryopsis sp. KO-2023]